MQNTYQEKILDIETTNNSIKKKLEGGIKFKIKSDFQPAGDQPQAIKSLTQNLKNKKNEQVLLGVTGSGKTLVYFERIKDFINKEQQALILLPEIALTNQFSRRFQDFFGIEPAIWHSRTAKKNKSIIWKGITEGKIKIVIGARSSLFLPFNNLGIILSLIPFYRCGRGTKGSSRGSPYL